MNKFNLLVNPALGSIAVTSFANSYYQGSNNLPLILCFLVAPLTLQKDVRDTILSSNTFQSFINKLRRDHKEQLARINSNIIGLRELSFQSIVIAESAGFLSIDCEQGIIKIVNPLAIPTIYNDNKILIAINKAAKKIGKFFSQLEIITIFKYLNVEP